MAQRLRFLAPAALATAAALSAATQPPPAPQQPASQQPPRQPSDVNLIIGERIDTPPNFAVPHFLALSNDPETVAAAKLIAQGAVGRSTLRARVPPDSPRHLRDDSASAVASGRPLRPLAGTGHRRRGDWHRPADWRRPASGAGSAVQRTLARVGLWRRVHGLSAQSPPLRTPAV